MVFGTQRIRPKRKTIRRRLTNSNIVVMVLMIVAIVSGLLLLSINTLIRDSMRYNDQLVQTMSNSFDNMWLSFKQAINHITMNEEFQQVLSAGEEVVYENNEDRTILRSLITNTALLSDDMDKIHVYDRDANLKVMINKKYRRNEQYVLYPTLDESWFDMSGKVASRVVDGRVIFTRVIYSMTDLDKIGYIICVYDQAALERRVSTIVPTRNRFVIIFDDENEIVVHNHANGPVTDDMAASLRGRAAGIDIRKVPGIGSALVAQHTGSAAGWQTVSVVALSDILRSTLDFVALIATLGVVAIAACILIQWLLARRITGPLEAIVTSISDARDGDYTHIVKVDTGDEIEVLATTYNSLMERTDTLVNQVLKGEIEYRNAQIQALQSQINPHLLFNTLECINWLAEYGRKEEIRRVTTSFSKLMKSTMQGPQMVTLAQELELAEDFLVIYRILLEDRLSYSIDLGDAPPDTMLPRLTIQPLVENAVVHGIKRSVQNGNIHIVAALSSGGVMITVIDDGVGMEEADAEAVNAYAAGATPDGPSTVIGVGFRNVIDRLRLIYGPKARLHVSSSLDWGTTISLQIPETGQEEQDEQAHTCD